MTGIGKVERAMKTALLETTGGTLPDHLFAVMANAGILAIREPNEAMIASWKQFEPYWDNSTVPPRLTHKLMSGPDATWQAAIDALLNEKAP